MEHPFITDLSEKTLDQLQETISGLNQKLTFAYRTGNQALVHQLHMALESYRNQERRKMDQLFDKHKLNSQINVQQK
jgi:aspartyl aminopeptidase